MARTRRDEAGWLSPATREKLRRRCSRRDFRGLYIFRPAYIYPVEPRKEPNFSYRVLRSIYPVFRMLFPNQVIRADDLARTMADAAVRGIGAGRTLVLENRDIRHLVVRSRAHH